MIVARVLALSLVGFRRSIGLSLLLFSLFCHASVHFIALSDIHLDPFYGCQMRRAKCPLVSQLIAKPVAEWPSLLTAAPQQANTNITKLRDSQNALFQASVAQLSALAKKTKPSFVIVTGDFLAHQLRRHYQQQVGSLKGYQAFVDKIYAYIDQQLQQAIGEKPLYWVMGNNDGYWGNYVFRYHDPFYQQIFHQWHIPKDSYLTFAARGEYTFPISSGIDGLVLNSVIYDKRTSGDKTKGATDSLNYLEHQLRSAKKHHRKVVIFYHVPYGIDPKKSWTTERQWCRWTYTDGQRFLSLMQHYHSTVIAIVHGHLHRQLFASLQRDPRHPLPQQLVPSVSPIVGNQPAMAVFTLADGSLSEAIVSIPLVSANTSRQH